MRDIEYEAPQTLAAAIEIMGQKNGRARALAGGTDLIDHVRMGRIEPDFIVDLKKIPELNVLELSPSGLKLGAAVPCYKIYDSRPITQQYSALADSCRIIGGVQIQSRASVGGNICNSGPAADSTPSVIALEGVCVIAGPQGTRRIAAESFCTGPGKNVLEPGEILVAIEFPARPANSGSHYRRIIPRNEMDIAVVGVGASVVLDPSQQKFTSARVSLGAVAPTPLYIKEIGDALAGKPVTDETIASAAELARSRISPISDMRGTREYRIHVAGVLVERVIKTAVARARGEKVETRPGH